MPCAHPHSIKLGSVGAPQPCGTSWHRWEQSRRRRARLPSPSALGCHRHQFPAVVGPLRHLGLDPPPGQPPRVHPPRNPSQSSTARSWPTRSSASSSSRKPRTCPTQRERSTFLPRQVGHLGPPLEPLRFRQWSYRYRSACSGCIRRFQTPRITPQATESDGTTRQLLLVLRCATSVLGRASKLNVACDGDRAWGHPLPD